MTFLLGSLPVAVAILWLVFRRGPAGAAVVGLLAAVLITVWGPFSIQVTEGTELLPYAGLTLEVLTILLFGMLLARLLQEAGAMKRIGAFLEQAAPSRMGGTAMVVFGVVPFAESVTGFGIGITVGVPILLSLGHPPARSALLGLFGMVAVPWGAMGPGTAVAASLAGLELYSVGVATGVVNLIPTLVSVGAVLWFCKQDRTLPTSLGLLATAVTLWAAILAANILFGTPPAGVVGSLVVIGGLLGVFRLRGRRLEVERMLARSLLPYGVLTIGILAARLLLGESEHVLAEILTSPSTWLAVACCVVPLVFLSGDFRRKLVSSSFRAWMPVGISTGAFMAMGWLMAVNGMSEAIGSAVSFAGTLPGPFLTSLGSVLTGSNTGANAMFASTVLALASHSGAEPLITIAIANAAGCFAALAMPPRVAMVVALAHAGKSETPDPRITRRLLAIAFLVAGISTTLLALLGPVIQLWGSSGGKF